MNHISMPGLEPNIGSVPKSSLAGVSKSTSHEENETYPAVARLNSRWRVVVCANSTQWVLQRRWGVRWRGVWFCRTREALFRGAREHAGQMGGDARAVLLRLPERISGAP